MILSDFRPHQIKFGTMLYARGSCLFRCISRCPAIQPRWAHVLMAEKEGSSSAPRRASTTGKKKVC